MAIEAGGIRILARELGVVGPKTRALLRPAIRAAASSVVAEARSNAGYSSRIPGAISVGVGFSSRTGGVSIRVSAKKAPHARALEGATRTGATRPSFRHPVFGRDTWVEQGTRPFLFPAVRAKRGELEAGIRTAISTALPGGLNG